MISVGCLPSVDQNHLSIPVIYLSVEALKLSVERNVVSLCGGKAPRVFRLVSSLGLSPRIRPSAQLPQRRSAGRLRRLLQGARAKPRLRGAGAHRRDTCHSARACSRDAAGSWSFRAVPEAQGSPNGPVPRSAPAGCPAALVHNDDQCG